MSQPAPRADVPDRRSPVPRPAVALAWAGPATLVVAVTAWLAVQPGAASAQAQAVEWFNDPPQPFAAVLAVANPFLRPTALLVIAAALVLWVLVAAPGTSWRLEVLRALVGAVLVAELVTQVLKRLADQPRPLEVIPGLDPHGYPGSPHGNAFPSAHTSVAVAVVVALWPWTRRPQRVAGVTLAVLVATNRLYIGAHWPLDVIGGAAIGLVSGSVLWLVAGRWPLVGRVGLEPTTDGL